MKTLLPSLHYIRPHSLDEAIKILEEKAEKTEILAGGTDLLVKLKNRLSYDRKILLDVNRLKELEYIKENGGKIWIGALTRIETLRLHPLIRERAPLLAEVAKEFGTWQIRNMATVGGNIANASNANDCGVALLALNAEVKLKSSKKERTLSIGDMFISNHVSAINRDEIIIDFSFDAKLTKNVGTSFTKMEGRESSSYPIVNAAVYVELENGSTIRDVRLALGGVSNTPIRLEDIEEDLKDRRADEPEKIFQKLLKVKDIVNPPSSTIASKKYRAGVSYVLLKRALEKALSRVSENSENWSR